MDYVSKSWATDDATNISRRYILPMLTTKRITCRSTRGMRAIRLVALLLFLWLPCHADEAPTARAAASRPSPTHWEGPRATFMLFVNDLQDGDVDHAAERIAFAPGDAGDAEREILDTAAATCKAFMDL